MAARNATLNCCRFSSHEWVQSNWIHIGWVIMANKSWREIFGEWVHGVIENGFQRSRLGDGLEVMLVLGHQRAVIPHFTLRFHRIGDVAVGGVGLQISC